MKNLTAQVVASLMLLPFFFEAGLALELSPVGAGVGVLLLGLARWLPASVKLRLPKLVRDFLGPHLLELLLACVYPSLAMALFCALVFFARAVLLQTRSRRDDASRTTLFTDLGLTEPQPDSPLLESEPARERSLRPALRSMIVAAASLIAIQLLPRWSAFIAAAPFLVFAVHLLSMLTFDEAYSASTRPER